MNISLDQTTATACEECGVIYFQQVYHIRKASGLLVGNTKPTYIPIPVFACIECNHVNTEFLPQEVKNLDKE